MAKERSSSDASWVATSATTNTTPGISNDNRAHDNDNPTNAQSKRPGLSRLDSGSDHAFNHQQPHHPGQHRTSSSSAVKQLKQHHVAGTRTHARVPSSKALHGSTAKLSQHRRQSSQHQQLQANQQQSASPERPPMLAATHRRATSELKLSSRDPSTTNLKKNSSHSSLKHAVKRPKSSTHIIKRSSSHKDVTKHQLKVQHKGQVHFDLGNEEATGDDYEDAEWVDASGSASPYMSRRGSILGTGHSSADKAPVKDSEQTPQTPPPSTTTILPTAGTSSASLTSATADDTPKDSDSLNRDTIHHKEYLTSRLLQRTPPIGAPPKMSDLTASVHRHPASPGLRPGHESSSHLAMNPGRGIATSRSSKDELTSRFVDTVGSGPGSGSGLGATAEAGSLYSPTRTGPPRRSEHLRRPRSLGNLAHDGRDSETEEEDDSALAPRGRRSGYRAMPAEKSRTQQKLNLQRQSSSIEPTQAAVGVGAVGHSPLVGGGGYDTRDPRIGKLLERTGMEYLVVRRYQNPIARSIARLSQLPGANKNRRIPRQNGQNGGNAVAHTKKISDLAGPKHGLSQSLGDANQGNRPLTPARAYSIRTNGANSSFDAEDDRTLQDRVSGSSYVDTNDDGVAAILRNLWDKNLDLSASAE